jgi:hypothetical protein
MCTSVLDLECPKEWPVSVSVCVCWSWNDTNQGQRVRLVRTAVVTVGSCGAPWWPAGTGGCTAVMREPGLLLLVSKC